MIEKLSMRLFGDLVSSRAESFDSVKNSMRKAGMGMPVHEYMANIFLITLLSFIFSIIFVTAFVIILLPTLPFSFGLGILISVGVTALVFFLGYSYPSLRARSLKGKIDRALPFAVFFMATTASSGAHPSEIFRMLSLRGGILGSEATRIYASIKTMGVDIVTALQRAALRSPSTNFSELLWGMTSIITTGGSMEAYLKSKTRTFMNQYRRSLDDYAKSIALYTEIYVTLIIVGSLFFIILISIISPLVGGNTLLLQSFLVFFFIPLVSAGFIMLLKSTSPTE